VVPVALEDRRLHLKEKVHWSLPLSHAVVIQHLKEVRGCIRASELTPQLPLECVPVPYPVKTLGVDDSLRSAPTACSSSPDVGIISCGSYQVFNGPNETLHLLVSLQGLTGRGFSFEVGYGVSGHKIRDDIPGSQ